MVGDTGIEPVTFPCEGSALPLRQSPEVGTGFGTRVEQYGFAGCPPLGQPTTPKLRDRVDSPIERMTIEPRDPHLGKGDVSPTEPHL